MARPSHLRSPDDRGKIDPETGTWDVLDGLDGAYPRSDTTGGQLDEVDCGVPRG